MAAVFPSVDNANEDGLLAVGGSLDSETLITAYKNGIFPWPVEDGYPMTWFAPNPRGIIDLEEFKVSKSLTKFFRLLDSSVCIHTSARALIMNF